MRKRSPQLLVMLTLLSSSVLVLADDKPGPLASPDTKLDYLISSWVGRSLEELANVWGAETEVGRRGDHQLYVYEQTSRLRGGFSPLSGTVSVSRGGITCRATFEVDAEATVVRATRRGGGKTCWDMFRRLEPPE